MGGSERLGMARRTPSETLKESSVRPNGLYGSFFFLSALKPAGLTKTCLGSKTVSQSRDDNRPSPHDIGEFKPFLDSEQAKRADLDSRTVLNRTSLLM